MAADYTVSMAGSQLFEVKLFQLTTILPISGILNKNSSYSFALLN
jgi:hypothetical protein